MLPREQCKGIKDFIVELIISVSQDEEKSIKEKVYLHKLNMILVQILKQEWPKNWPTFISGNFFYFIQKVIQLTDTPICNLYCNL